MSTQSLRTSSAPASSRGDRKQVADHAVEVFGLFADRRQKIGSLLVAQPVAKVGQAGRRAEDRGERRAEIVADRSEQRVADALGFGIGPRLVDLPRQGGPIDRRSRLLGQGVNEPALVGVERTTGASDLHPQRADRASPNRQRQEEPGGVAVIRTARSGRLPTPEGPGRGGARRIAEPGVRRADGGDHQFAGRFQEDGALSPGDGAHLRRRGVGHRFPTDNRRQSAGERVEVLDGPLPFGRHPRPLARLAGDGRGDHRDDQEPRQRDHFPRLGNRQRVARLDEEEIVGEKGQERREDGRPDAIPNGRNQHRQQQDQGDVGEIEPLGHRFGQQKRDRDAQRRRDVAPHRTGTGPIGARD